MSGHGHSHGGCCDHGPELGESTKTADEYSLYLKIDLERVVCLNESVNNSGKEVFKPWDRRLDTEKYVESDGDEELLFNIPFTGMVKLKSLIVIGGQDDSHPSKMKLYKNRPNMTFDDTSCPDQEMEMQPDNTGVLEYPVKVARFNSIQHLSIYFPSNFGADTSIVYYIGLKGDFTEAQREPIVITNYELAPNPADHKNDLFDSAGHQIH